MSTLPTTDDRDAAPPTAALPLPIPEQPRTWILTVRFMLVGLVAVTVAALVQWNRWPSLPITGVYSFSLFAAAFGMRRSIQARFGSEGVLLAVTILLFLAPWVCLMAAYPLGRAVVESRWRCGTGDAAVIAMTPFLLLAATQAATRAASALTRRRQMLHLDRWAGRAALGAWIVVAILTAAAALRARRWPDADGWLDGLEYIGTVSPADWRDARSMPNPLAVGSGPTHMQTVSDARVGGFDLVRTCRSAERAYCGVGLRGFETPVGIEWRADPTESIDLHYDRLHGYLLVRGERDRWRTIFHGHEIVHSLCMHQLADGLSAPRGWIVVSFLGLLLAAALLVLRARSDRDVAGTTLIEALLVDGAFELANGTRLPASPNARPRTPGLHTLRIRRETETHRTMGISAPLAVYQGDLATVRDARALRQATLAMLALAISAMTFAPLVAAATHGLAWG